MEEKATIEEIRLLLKYISKGYKVPQILHDEVMNAAKREIEQRKRVVLIKRDPDVERGRFQSRYVKIIDGSTMEIHPATISPFGADFDGDSVLAGVFVDIGVIDNESGQTIKQETVNCQLEDILSKTNAFEFYKKDVKSNGVVVKKYKSKENYIIKIESINIDTGECSMKKILDYSIHENIDMYKISDSQNRFEAFWSSSDHSLIIYDEEDDKIKKISPIELLSKPDNKFIIQNEEMLNESRNHDRIYN